MVLDGIVALHLAKVLVVEAGVYEGDVVWVAAIENVGVVDVMVVGVFVLFFVFVAVVDVVVAVMILDVVVLVVVAVAAAVAVVVSRK